MNIARISSFDPLIGIRRERGSEAELKWRPRGASDSDVQYAQYLTEVLCPRIGEMVESRSKLPQSVQLGLVESSGSKSLRQLATEYGVSHESVRRALKAASTSS
jgi:hypothetical protein